MTLQWICKTFDELTPHELYAIMQLRIEVFIVEQNCVFQDADNKDQYGFHMMGWSDSLLAAYARLLPAVTPNRAVSIGRVVVSPKTRAKGLGRELMQGVLAECERLFGKTPIKLSAQLYLKMFYESLGFRPSGAVYVDDGIDHIEMTLE